MPLNQIEIYSTAWNRVIIMFAMKLKVVKQSKVFRKKWFFLHFLISFHAPLLIIIPLSVVEYVYSESIKEDPRLID